MSLPLVSVAIPAYNHAQYIEACLASVCAQTYPELELVLIDDGSKDDTLAVARRYLDKHGGRFRRIVLERQENQGVSATSNAVIAASQGEWVHLLGSDDLLYPNKIAHIQQAIEEWNCPELALVHADADYVDQYGQLLARQPRKSRPAPGPDYEAWHWLFKGRHYVFNPTLAFRREAVLSIGGFDNNLPQEDLDCFLRLSTRYALARVPEILASYRKHPGNNLRRRVRVLGALFLTYGKFLEAHGNLILEEELRVHYRQNLKRLWRRVRRQRPWLFPTIIGALLKSRIYPPKAGDYRRFGQLLNQMAT